MVLTLSSSLQVQNQQIKRVIELQTNQSDLDWWIEVPVRLEREPSCGQDVCETGFALGCLGFPGQRVSERRYPENVNQLK